MIEIREKKHCCGCGACVQKCPVHCIEMNEDREGFLYPQGNKEKCMNCGCCENVCPVINKSTSAEKLKECYVCYAYDNMVRINSSSGGAFSLLATEILEDGGIVYGAAFDSDYMVHHIRIDHINQLSAVQKSKYLQSRTGDTFIKTKNDLTNGRRVLYSGTTCQIEGLKKYLGQEYNNLITVDLLCHGTPSPMVWKQYLNSLNYKRLRRIIDVDFRNKDLGWKNYSLKISYDSDEYFAVSHNKDTYMNLFLSNVILRPSCYECQFKNINRISDITLGDAWGIKKIAPEMDDNKGTSLLLVHTEKGMEYTDRLRAKMHVETIELNRILPPEEASRVSVKKHPKREEFFKKLWGYGISAFNWWDWQRKRKRLKDNIKRKIQLVFVKTKERSE